MKTPRKTKKDPVYDIAEGRMCVPDEPVQPVEIQTDPWDEYRDLEASRNQSDILLAILHELVKLRSAR